MIVSEIARRMDRALKCNLRSIVLRNLDDNLVDDRIIEGKLVRVEFFRSLPN